MSIEEQEQKATAPARKGVFARGVGEFKNTIREAADYGALKATPYGLLPVLLLGLSGLAAGINSGLFGLVLPDIVRDLNVKVVTLLTVFNLIGFFLIFAIVGLAYVLDRKKRVPFVGGATVLQGVFSTATSVTHTLPTLGTAQVFSSVSDNVAGVPSFALAADYYPVETRGRMYALLNIQGAATAFAPLAVGYLVVKTSWRVPFVLTGALLMAVGIVMLLKLKEPVRGYMERKALGMPEEEAVIPEPAPSFGEAWRTIWGIKTVGRLFMGGIIADIGASVVARIYPLFLFERYGLDSFGRGRIIFVRGIFIFAGSFFAGGVVDLLIKKRPQRVLSVSAALGVLAGVFTFVQGTGLPLWGLYGLSALFGLSSALLGPARNVLLTNIIPANVRTMGVGVFALGGIPSVIGFQLLLGRLDSWGLQGLLIASAPFYILGALIDLSAASLFPRDLRSAISSQAASEEYRRTKAAGKVKLLVCRDVDVDYDGVKVLFGVDFDLEDGEIVALLGTNGAGKSTLLRAISGIREASGGAIVFDGRDITHVPPYEVTSRGVVHMPGGRGVFPGLTVRENLLLGGWVNQDEAVSKERLSDVYEIFPALKARAEARAGTLSGGEQQMVALAQAFLSNPRLLMIDELSLGLSPAMVEMLLEAVREINRRGVAIVIVEQSVNVALTIAERAIFMEKGEVKFIGRTSDLLSRPDILRAVYVKGTGALTEGPVGALKGDRRTRADRLGDARAILDVQGISKAFGGVHAVNDVSFSLREGEILGLIGPNGAGKTTIFDLISGNQIPDSGIVYYDGQNVTSMGPDERARLQLIRRFQDAKLFPSLSVYESLLVALERKNDVKNIVLTTLQVPQVRASERRVRRRADALIGLLELGAFRDKFVKELSTGLRRILDIACVLAAEPKVLLLDEPSSGIAQAESESLGPLLRRVRHETGCSILIIEHDMPLISSLSDELIALDQGSVVTRGTPEVVLNDPRVVESYLGTQENVIKRSGVIA